jgi:hypothetical protein
MSTNGGGSSNVTMLRLEYPQTVSEVIQFVEPRLDTVEIRDPPSWLRQLVYQHEQAKRDLQHLYELSGNQLDRDDHRIRAIERSYATIYHGLQYLYEQGKNDTGASHEWLQTELAHTAQAAQCFTQDVWKAITNLTTEAGDRLQAQQLQLARNNDVIAFLHAAGAHRDQEVATLRANMTTLAAEQQTRTDQVIAEQQRLRSELAASRPTTGPYPRNGAPGPSSHPAEPSRTPDPPIMAANAPQAAVPDQDLINRMVTALAAAQAVIPPVLPARRANTAKMRMDNPEKFNGKPRTPFRLWWESVQEYVGFYPDTEGAQWISWVGTLLTDEAKAWHHHRRRVLGNTDTWVAYQAAIQAEYHDAREAANAHAELSRLRYKGDIKAYLNEFRTLNLIAGATGQGLQEKIDLAMPEDILDMRAAQFRGILVADEDFLAATEEAGQQIERNKALKAMRRELKGHHYVPDNTGPKSQKDSGKEGRSAPTANPSPSFAPRGMGKRIYGHWKDAIRGVSPAEVEEYRAAKVGCWRCGREGHQATECFAKTTKKGTPLPAAPVAAAAASKRKSEEDVDTPEGATTKRVDATAAGILGDENGEVPPWADDSEEDF